MPLPAVTVTFDLLNPKSNQHIYEPKYIFVQNWIKFPSLLLEIWCLQGFLDAKTHRRTHPNTECLQHQRFSVVEAKKISNEEENNLFEIIYNKVNVTIHFFSGKVA